MDAFVLWHEKQTNVGGENTRQAPIGFVSFSPPSLASTSRHELFGKHFQPATVNKWFSLVSRVVMDPRYRGAGIASTMLRMSCRAHARRKDVKYIEAKTSMGAVNKFNQAAGFRLIAENDQLGRGAGAGGGTMGVGREKGDSGEWDDQKNIRKIYEFIMDTEDELGIKIDY